MKLNSQTHFHFEDGALSGEGTADKFLLYEWHQGNLSVPGIETADGCLPHLRLRVKKIFF